MKALIILAQDGYQDLEYAGTRSGLVDADYNITIASSVVGMCTGKLGGSETADIAIGDVDVAEYDLIVFVGGPGAAAFAQNPSALLIAKEAAEQGKKLGAICIAPTILARAGVLQGKRATVWDSGGAQAAILEEEGATYTGEDVTLDGNIVTGNGPDATEKFGKMLGVL